MVGLLEAVALGVVQGITEWLPVSSSGHLVLAEHFLGVDVPVFFDLVLHLGTLVVVLFFYRKTLVEIARAMLDAPRARRKSGGSWARVLWDDPLRRLGLLVVLGTVPTAVIGLAFEDAIVALFDAPLFVAGALLATGTALWFTRAAAWRDPKPLTWGKALLIGAAQGVAIMPGVSRSGATISAAAYLGVDRETAVRYSFLLSIPAIVGAAVLQTDLAAVGGLVADWPAYAAGFAVALLVGYASLRFLVMLVQRDRFHWFAVYCWAAGGVALVFVLV